MNNPRYESEKVNLFFFLKKEPYLSLWGRSINRNLLLQCMCMCSTVLNPEWGAGCMEKSFSATERIAQWAAKLYRHSHTHTYVELIPLPLEALRRVKMWADMQADRTNQSQLVLAAAGRDLLGKRQRMSTLRSLDRAWVWHPSILNVFVLCVGPSVEPMQRTCQ